RKLRNPRPHSFFPCHDPNLSIYWPSPNRCVCRSRGARGEARTLNAQRSAIYPPADTRHMWIFVFELRHSVRFDPLTDSKEVKNPHVLRLLLLSRVCSASCRYAVEYRIARATSATWPKIHSKVFEFATLIVLSLCYCRIALD